MNPFVEGAFESKFLTGDAYRSLNAHELRQCVSEGVEPDARHRPH